MFNVLNCVCVLVELGLVKQVLFFIPWFSCFCCGVFLLQTRCLISPGWVMWRWTPGRMLHFSVSPLARSQRRSLSCSRWELESRGDFFVFLFIILARVGKPWSQHIVNYGTKDCRGGEEAVQREMVEHVLQFHLEQLRVKRWFSWSDLNIES